MHYFEKFKDKEVSGITGILSYFLITIVIAPFRLLITIAEKILLIGDEIISIAKKLLALNIILLIINVLYDLLIQRCLDFLQGSFTTVSLIVSLILSVLFYYFTQYFYYPINLEKEVKETLEEPESVEEVKSNNVEELDFETPYMGNNYGTNEDLEAKTNIAEYLVQERMKETAIEMETSKELDVEFDKDSLLRELASLNSDLGSNDFAEVIQESSNGQDEFSIDDVELTLENTNKRDIDDILSIDDLIEDDDNLFNEIFGGNSDEI